MASAKKKKPGRKVHIDNLHLVKKLEPAYTEAFFDFEEVLLREPIEDEKINIIANIAIEQLQEGMAKKKKPSLIISKEKHYQTYITKMSKGQAFSQMREKLLRQNYEKMTISGIWLVFSVCILLLFFKNLLTEHYLINFSVDLAIDIVTLVLCIIVKLLVSGNFDVSYLLLVIAYFVTKRRYRKELEEQLPS